MVYLQRKVKMPDQRTPEEQYDFFPLQKPKCKQPKASKAAACKVLYIGRKEMDGWSKG